MNWKWFWRGLGILGAITMLALLAQVWASLRAVNVTPVAKGQPLQDGLDIIAIQLDILSLVIAVAGIGLAVAGIVGYQSIKDAAIAKADEVATASVSKHIKNIEDRAGLGPSEIPATDGLEGARIQPSKEIGDGGTSGG